MLVTFEIQKHWAWLRRRYWRYWNWIDWSNFRDIVVCNAVRQWFVGISKLATTEKWSEIRCLREHHKRRILDLYYEHIAWILISLLSPSAVTNTNWYILKFVPLSATKKKSNLAFSMGFLYHVNIALWELNYLSISTKFKLVIKYLIAFLASGSFMCTSFRVPISSQSLIL